ncbi:MAG: Rieske 2Fe-2S domain-containing protein [Nitriliruptorales bacterium]|nr:Rieske 2Fe-2S domain-containing protein [Nitriliruptorales bacterium]
MAEWFAGRISDFDHERRNTIEVNGREVVVLRNNGRFYALENNCLHMGGPVGEGMLMGKVEAVLTEDKRCLGDRFSEEEIHIVCPWHGWEYDIDTGEFAGDRKRRLRRYDVTTRGDEVYVQT